MSLIHLKNVDVHQDVHLILSKVNLEINKGEWVYLLGKTGSGKSSLLKLIYADIPATKGEMTVCGFDMQTIKRKEIHLLRRNLGVVFQDFQLLPDLNVEENLKFVLKATDWKDRKKIEKKIEESLLMVGMQNKKLKAIHELSGGEKQRVAIARALLNDPKLIIADEPTGNLDPKTSREIIRLLKDIQEDGQAVLIVTHDYSLIEEFPAPMYFCDKGKLKNIDKLPEWI